MPPRSSRWILCYAIAAAGCSRGDASFPTAESWPDSPRRADGVAVDPAAPASSSQRNGRTGEVFAVPLSPPAPVSLAVRAVVAFFDALPREDLATLNLPHRLLGKILAAPTLSQGMNPGALGIFHPLERVTGMTGLTTGGTPGLFAQALGLGFFRPVRGRGA